MGVNAEGDSIELNIHDEDFAKKLMNFYKSITVIDKGVLKIFYFSQKRTSKSYMIISIK